MFSYTIDSICLAGMAVPFLQLQAIFAWHYIYIFSFSVFILYFLAVPTWVLFPSPISVVACDQGFIHVVTFFII